MQVLTASQSAMLKMTANASFEALQIVEFAVCGALDDVLVALTSDRAIRIYRNTWETVDYVARVFMTIAFLSGCLARVYFDQFMGWQERYVAECQQQPTAPEPVAVEPEPTPEPATVEPEPTPEPVTVTPEVFNIEQPELTTLTTAQLRKMAVTMGHKGAGRLNKARLLELLAA